MNIATYYPWVYLTSGVERTIVEMCRRSRHTFTVFTNHYEPENTYPEFGGIRVVQLPYIPVRRQLAPVLMAALTIASHKLPIQGFDALLVHCDGLGNLALNRVDEIPAICMCHTPLRPVYDPHYRERALSRLNGPSRLAFNVFSAAFASVDRHMFRRYRYVVFNSSETLMRAKRGGLLELIDDRYAVVHPGVDWHSYQPSWRYDRYFLVAGRIMWTKNIEMGIDAFIQFKAITEANRDFRLVIAGRVDKKSDVYIERLRMMAAGRADIDFVVSPSDEILQHLYANCYGLVFPAFNEDWGMVPLEANAFGKAVIATDLGGPTESQTDGETGFLVACDSSSFASAMTRLAADPSLAREMGARARTGCRQYDWSNFVDSMDSLLDAAVVPIAGGVHAPPRAQESA